MANFTPGPWTHDDDHKYVRMAEGEKRLFTAAVIEIPYEAGGREVAKANANLISAAPELWQFLNKLLSLWDQGELVHSGFCEPGIVTETIQDARAALAKAEGRAQ